MAKSRTSVDNHPKKSAQNNNLTVNGVTFQQLKAIRNAILHNDTELLSSPDLMNVLDINYLYEFYNDNLFIIDWTSDIREMGDSIKMTLLHFAARLGRADCVEILIKQNANPNIYSFRNNFTSAPLLTPLHEVCCGWIDDKSNFAKTAEILLKNGADMELRTYNSVNKETAYELCMNNKNNDVISIEKKTPNGRSFTVFEIPDYFRTAAAEQVKEIFTKHKYSFQVKLY